MSKRGDEQEREVENKGPKFSPPVYIQRYVTVREILSKESNIRKVVDFGCSDGAFFKYLKKLPGVEEIALVDVDANVINTAAYKARPLVWDYVFKRQTSLTVKLFVGSVLEPDVYLQKFDAVTCIELIEHLRTDDVSNFPSSIFASIQPKIAIVTTPNSDFNVLFPGLNGFRHWDHKFEWTKAQFQKWCHDIVQCYPHYNVEFIGVGEPPDDCKNLGYCTQIAIFRRIDDKPIECKLKSPGSYVLVREICYPGEDEDSNLKQNMIS